MPDYVCLSIAVLGGGQNPVPGSLMFGVQIHSGSADGPTHFMNEQATHINLVEICYANCSTAEGSVAHAVLF